jgi:hypothetical protein
MRIPKAAWWVLAPLSWVWQYLVYVPAHLLWDAVLFFLPGDPRAGRVEDKLRLRPWFVECLR